MDQKQLLLDDSDESDFDEMISELVSINAEEDPLDEEEFFEAASCVTEECIDQEDFRLVMERYFRHRGKIIIY